MNCRDAPVLWAPHRHRAGVGFGLHQAGDELHLTGANDGGGPFQPDIVLEPFGRDVLVLLPPARRAGLAGEYQQRFALVKTAVEEGDNG